MLYSPIPGRLLENAAMATQPWMEMSPEVDTLMTTPRLPLDKARKGPVAPDGPKRMQTTNPIGHQEATVRGKDMRRLS